ncbi:hypothetical protein E3N86_00790 [Cryobacterium sp. Hz7]|uniref:hypothetical protein n=1 Tax=Cryobacterium sp. Hz7 TaxID=1259166 RepID=UPI001069A21D|nr:hypothetical protein [Cryobacterium sp. Hz7]TFB66933.1 hypothetical protein E3N86_00790 [Cryobacterium sp. Hz7]
MAIDVEQRLVWTTIRVRGLTEVVDERSSQGDVTGLGYGFICSHNSVDERAAAAVLYESTEGTCQDVFGGRCRVRDSTILRKCMSSMAALEGDGYYSFYAVSTHAFTDNFETTPTNPSCELSTTT